MATLRRVPPEYVDYLLCRFIRAAGEVSGRIRMQKVAFLLGVGGAPLFQDYFYHLRGPYSPALANAVGRLVDQGLIDERAEELRPDVLQYRYKITQRGEECLQRFEAHPSVEDGVGLGNSYEPRFKELVRRNARELELAATVAYWKEQGYDWDKAIDITADLKRERKDSTALTNAALLARWAVGTAER